MVINPIPDNTTDNIFIQLQAKANQLLTDMNNFNIIVNGDANTTVTLPSGIIVPTVQKVLQDIQNGFDNLQGKFNTLVLGGQQALVSALQETTVYDFVVSNPNIDQTVTINNLLVIYSVSVNGLDQDDNDYIRVGNTITLPVSNGFNVSDKIAITYIPTN